MTRLAETWDEDRLHRWLARRPGAKGVVGPSGHDAVVLAGAGARRTVACCDQVVEGVHAEVGTAAARLGDKAACRAISDLAATAARPRALLAALRAPRETAERRLRALLAAVDDAGRRFGAPLVGGDLACAEGALSLAVTALGDLPATGRPPHRTRGRAGQVLVATGGFGGSGLGRHLRLEPRVAAGRWLADRGATAMMDVSDGLAWDLYRLARASGLQLVLEHVPVHADARRAARRDGRSALDHALHDGEDHELVALLPAAAARRALAEAPAEQPLVRLGRAVAGRGLRLELEGLRRAWRPDEGGWRHGG